MPEHCSDSSDTDELVDSQDIDNPSTTKEMGNNLSSEYDPALEAIPNTPSIRPTSLEGPSSVSRSSLDTTRPSENVRPFQHPAPGELSSENCAMDDPSGPGRNPPKNIVKLQSLQSATSKESATTVHEQKKDVDRPLRGSSEDSHSDQTLPSTNLFFSDLNIVNNGLTLAPACTLASTRPQPLSPKLLARQFPLSPPRLPQAPSPSVLKHDASDESNHSETDELPQIEQLIARLTQPNQQGSPSRRTTKRPAASSRPHSSNRSPSPMAPIKRQMSDSPRILSQPLPKKRRMNNTKTKAPVEYIEVLDSSSDEQPLKKVNKVAKSPPPSQLHRPTPKLKRKTLPPTTETPTSTSLSCPQVSLSQCRPPKRTKSYQKHPVYWHLDGNVHIQIAGTCFRLHRSILARQSKWFEKMFDPREQEMILHSAEEPYDLTHLGITVEDFEEVLCALEDTHACFQGELPFSRLDSLLRVSTVLGFIAIEKYASNALSAMWSADLADVGIDKIECPTESLALARQCALFPVVKRTLYELVRLSNFGQTKIVPGNVSAASMVRLGPYDKDLLLTAREYLGIAWRKALDVDRFPTCVAQQGIVDGTGTSAENIPACAATNHVLSLVAHHEIIKEHDILAFEYDPVSGLQVLAAAPWKEKGFCQACVEQRQNYWLKERERIWQKLDEWFEV
ncbi:hypothetical protein C0995_014414 [Termitomyces sp. Mi166|nr:hypothetical protein C0995_014414 [Termitomyces sp. Mi166\